MDSAYRLINLMAEVEEDLPPFRAVFSPYDNPNIFITEETKSKAVEAGESGECRSSRSPFLRANPWASCASRY